jgi:hypothetical protein
MVRLPAPALARVSLLVAWPLTVAAMAWQLRSGRVPSGQAAPLVALGGLLVCSALLLLCVPCPLPDAPKPSARGIRPTIAHGAVVVALVCVRALAGRVIILLVAVAAAAVAATSRATRTSPTRPETLYAAGLSMVAGTAAYFTGGLDGIGHVQWAVLQATLVFACLVAGWGVLRRCGLLEQGIGQSRVVSGGSLAGGRSFLIGAVVATPWALGNVLMGAASQDNWVKAWWQPLVALQPGIAEEAWARLFLVPLLFLALRRVTGSRRALGGAMVVLAYWFAYLHTSVGPGSAMGVLVLGTLYALPLSFLCMFRDLETAIGFHFCVDFVRFAFAFMLHLAG